MTTYSLSPLQWIGIGAAVLFVAACALLAWEIFHAPLVGREEDL